MHAIRCLNHRLKPTKSTLQIRLFGLCRFQATKVQQIEHGQAADFVKVGWEDGTTSRFPFLYLREKCQCHSCFHESSQQRILHMKNLDLDSKPLSTTVKDNGDKIEVLWHDNHVSEFNSKWLYNKTLPEYNHGSKRESIIREGAQIWDKTFTIPTFEFKGLLGEEHSLLDWLQTLRHVGVAKVTGVPRKLGQLERLGKAVGYLKNTFYG